MKKQYCYSWDSERYYGEFDSEKEAIKDAKLDRPSAEYVYIGTCTKPELRWDSCEDEIIESIANNLYADCGELAEDFEVSDGDRLALSESLDETIMEWIKKRDIKADCYSVLDGHRIELF